MRSLQLFSLKLNILPHFPPNGCVAHYSRDDFLMVSRWRIDQLSGLVFQFEVAKSCVMLQESMAKA